MNQPQNEWVPEERKKGTKEEKNRNNRKRKKLRKTE
jgi:hypothetical protein